MSSTIRGTVAKVYEKNGMYSLAIDNVWYGFGKKKPQVDQGQFVTFAADKNDRGYWNADIKTLIVADRQSASSTRAPAPTGGLTKDQYWENREARDIETQKRIQYQSSRNAAIEFVRLLLDKDALKVPATVAKKADAILEAVNYYTTMFNDNTEVQGPTTETSSADEVEVDNEGDYDE